MLEPWLDKPWHATRRPARRAADVARTGAKDVDIRRPPPFGRARNVVIVAMPCKIRAWQTQTVLNGVKFAVLRIVHFWRTCVSSCWISARLPHLALRRFEPRSSSSVCSAFFSVRARFTS